MKDYEIINMGQGSYRIENGFVRFFLLEGDKDALLIDSGCTTENAKEIAEGITDKNLILINTHGDGDHTSGNGAFSSYYIDEHDYKACDMAEKYPNSKPVFTHDGMIIDLGNRPIKVINNPGHTVGSIALLDIKNRALYSGDSVSTAIIYMFGSHRDMDAYIRSLDRLNDLADEYDVIYPSHGSPSVLSDAVLLVKAELAKALANQLPCKKELLHGEKVLTYQGSFCGFYLPVKE